VISWEAPVIMTEDKKETQRKSYTERKAIDETKSKAEKEYETPEREKKASKIGENISK